MKIVKKLLKMGYFVSYDGIRILVASLIRDVYAEEIVAVVGKEGFLVEEVSISALHSVGVRVTKL